MNRKKGIEVVAEESRALSAPVVERAREFAVTDDPSFERGAALLKELVTARKAVDDLFTPIVRSVNAARNKVRAPLQQAEDRIRLELGKYAQAKERARVEAAGRELQEQQRLLALGEREEGEQGTTGEAPAASTPTPEPEHLPELPKPEGLGFRDLWCFEITNEAQIPREFLMPDETKIGRVVRALMSSTNIPGVRVFSRKVPVQR